MFWSIFYILYMYVSPRTCCRCMFRAVLPSGACLPVCSHRLLLPNPIPMYPEEINSTARHPGPGNSAILSHCSRYSGQILLWGAATWSP